MPFGYNNSKKETGVDVVLNIRGHNGEIPITSASFTEEADVSEVQFNDSYSNDIAVTGVSYSGSFEIAGRNNSLRDSVWSGSKANNESFAGVDLPQYVDSITFTDGGGYEYSFSDVIVESHSKDISADDRSTASYDFTAEKMTKDEPSDE